MNNPLLASCAVLLLAGPVLAGGAPLVKVRTLPTTIRTLRPDAVDPHALRPLNVRALLVPGVSLDGEIDALPVSMAFNVAETLEQGRIETVRNMDILRDVSEKNITPDVAFDGGAWRKAADAVAGQETTTTDTLSRFSAREKTAAKTLPAPGKTGKAALLTGLFSALPIALHADGLDGLFESLPYLGLFGVALMLLFTAAAGMQSEPDISWWEDQRLAQFVGDIAKKTPGVAAMRLGWVYSQPGKPGYEYLDVYFDSKKAMGKADLPARFVAGPHAPRDIKIVKKLRTPGKDGRGNEIWRKP